MKRLILIICLLFSLPNVGHCRELSEVRVIAIAPFGAEEDDRWIAEEMEWAIRRELERAAGGVGGVRAITTLLGPAPPAALAGRSDPQRAAALSMELEECRAVGADLLVVGWVARDDGGIEITVTVVEVATGRIIETYGLRQPDSQELYRHVPEIAAKVLTSSLDDGADRDWSPSMGSAPTLELTVSAGIGTAGEQAGLVDDVVDTLYENNDYVLNEFVMGIEADLMFRRMLGLEALVHRGWLRSYEIDNQGSRAGSTNRRADVTALRLGLCFEIHPLPTELDWIGLRLSVGAVRHWISFTDKRLWLGTALNKSSSIWGVYSHLDAVAYGPVGIQLAAGLAFVQLIEEGVVYRLSTPLYVSVGLGIPLIR